MLFVNSLYRPDPRGRMASSVFSANRYGNYEKMFKAPRQPRTGPQLLIRMMLTVLAKAWGAALTDSQRLAWEALSNRHPITKGDKTYTLAANVLYVKTNQNLATIGEARMDAAPTNFALIGYAQSMSVDIVSTPGTEDIKLNISPAIGAGQKVVVTSTGIVNPGAKPNFSKAKIIAILDHTFESGDSIKTGYQNIFGTLPGTGAKAGFTTKFITIADGQAGPEQVTTSVGTV